MTNNRTGIYHMDNITFTPFVSYMTSAQDHAFASILLTICKCIFTFVV